MGYPMYGKRKKNVFFLIIIFICFYLDNDIIQIPLAIVIIGCLANVFLLIVLFIILNDRTRGELINLFYKIKKEIFFLNLVQRYLASMILIFLTIIVECFLMLGLILCIAYCSEYITLASTSLDKGYFNYFSNFLNQYFFLNNILDIIASLLASLTTIISILFYTGILNLLGN